MSEQHNVIHLRPQDIDEGSPDMKRLVNMAKNLAWELKPNTPLFDAETIGHYWSSLPRETKFRYIGAVEFLVKGMLAEIEREQALSNSTRVWLEGYIR